MEKEKYAKCYLLIHNIAKPKNVGMIVRSACAFNVEKIYLISKDPEKKLKSKLLKDFGVVFGAQGTENKIEYEFFFSVKEAKQFFNEKGIKIVGIEIGDNARNLHKPGAFEGDTVFVPGNEGDGIIEPLKSICDYFVYIPQYTNKTASLNVAVATSIILAEFAKWAGYQEQQMFGEKYRSEEHEKAEKFEKIEKMKQNIGKRKPHAEEVGEESEEIIGSKAKEMVIEDVEEIKDIN